MGLTGLSSPLFLMIRSLPFRLQFASTPLIAGPLWAASSSAPATPARVSFNRDIRPIMSDTCFHCHGFDAKSRKAGMRLDLRDEALKPTKNGFVPIVPGKPEESEIILRINDKDEPMPPAEAHKTLTAAQKDLFRRWVAEGAVYEPHWAYAALEKPAVPAVPVISNQSTGAAPITAPPITDYSAASPIDAFIRAKLAEKKITPSAEAPKARLLRRLSLDLTGIPPTPDEVAAFLADTSPGAYERQVDRLLTSPRHGERMAVWWLDIARFSDTVGFHGDQNQRIFPYRDYVIGAFSANKRFDQFTIEQLAGDLLPAPTTEQIVATGYNRLNMMTREGGAQPKEYLAKYGAERVRSVAAAWFGSTFGCAECHDHKFDPIKARDFYELQSFFADVKQWGVYHDYAYTPNPELAGFSNDHPFPPELEVESPYLKARLKRLQDELIAERKAVAASVSEPAKADALAAWAQQAREFYRQNPSGWQQPAVTATLARAGKPVAKGEIPIGEDRVIRYAAELKRGESVQVSVAAGAGAVAAIQLELTEPPVADPEKKKSTTRNLVRLAAAIRAADGKERKLDFTFADATAKEPRYDGGAEILGIATGWKVPAGHLRKLIGTWLLAQPPTLAEGETLVLTLTGETVPPFRVALSPFATTDPLLAIGEPLRAALEAPKPSLVQTVLIANTWLYSTRADRAAYDRQQKLAAKIRETRDGRAPTLITQPMEPFTVRILARGNWQDENGPIVLPSTPSFLPARRESTPEKRLTRLDLAQWIVSKENPITSRVVMNRLWAMYFGTGLSAVIDDLGSQGELPSHPELLDWLASEFRDRGWNMRHMIRQIVTSATYRQSSSLRPELRDLDPGNRLLASQNPRRLEAEFVRDTALFAAGLLNLRDVGGPSVKPYQPAGYYAALQFPDRDYVASDDDEQWRRGVYMHWQRTFLHPMLANFDAPARDECAAARTVSNTPQQALTLLNDPTFVEAARVLAARAATGTDDARLQRLFQFTLGRDPKPAETAPLKSLLAKQREYFRATPDDATKVLRIGQSPATTGDAADLAAWTQVARVLLNSQEFITRY